MNNPAYDATKVFEGTEKYKERVVAFIDVMGVKNRMQSVKEPGGFEMFSRLMYMYGHQPFAEDTIETIMFSDCMYLVADPQYLESVLCLISNFAYNLLMNRTVEIKMTGKEIIETPKWDCMKLRGGITYGEVLVLDEEAKKKRIQFNSNIILGPAAVNAYTLESSKAIYPRIIADSSIERLIENNNMILSDYCLMKNSEDDYCYLDFCKYMFKHGGEPKDLFEGCFEYVKNELDSALKTGNAKLVGQLYWYLNYLEKYVHGSEKM